MILELRRGREVLAKLEPLGPDTPKTDPWMFANIFPTPAFEAVRDLFREQAAFESAKVRALLKQQQIEMCVAGHSVLEFTLIVEGGRARFKFDKIELK